MLLERRVAAGVAGLVLCVSMAAPAQASDGQRLIVRAPKPYTDLENLVNRLGGQVTQKYVNVDAVAVTVPKAAVAELTAAVGEVAISKDLMVTAPVPVEVASVASGEEVGALQVEGGTDAPTDYSFNNTLINVDPVHAAGHTGSGVVVAVIDSGTANWSGVFTLAGKVIGGEDFVPPGADTVLVGGVPTPADLSATSRFNNPHGTWVGTVIAANALVGFSNASTLVRSIKVHAPQAIHPAFPCPDPPAVATCAVPVVGVAPNSSLYALKVFPAPSGGAPESRIIAAMDRAITLRKNFDDGGSTAPVSGDGSENNPFVYDALNIQVVNMSLGGPTLFAARDLEDTLTRTMLDVGMTLVASAGNDGFAAMTGGSPGTGLGSLTVGAANTPAHERILRDAQFGVGIGELYRPSDAIQTAYFSSRGPTADGRLDPDITANGFATLAQSATGGISIVSGTSFSAPTVAGAAAVLRGAVPTATATQIRNSMPETANPAVLGDAPTHIDQGFGFLDVEAALARLNAGKVSKKLPDVPKKKQHGHGFWGHGRHDGASSFVELNVRKAGFRPVQFRGHKFETRVENLLPGEVRQFFVDSNEFIGQFVVTLSEITPELAPADQNQLFGDDVYVKIVDAPTSFERLRTEAFVNADSSFPVDNPQPGLLRVSLQGDWTNAGRISATLTIERKWAFPGLPSAIGRVAEGDTAVFEVEVPGGATEAVFQTWWKDNWNRYPTDDLDMILVAPDDTVELAGATLDSPERVAVAAPQAGIWTVLIQGFTIHDHDDDHDDDHGRPARETFFLRASADGKRLKAN